MFGARRKPPHRGHAGNSSATMLSQVAQLAKCQSSCRDRRRCPLSEAASSASAGRVWVGEKLGGVNLRSLLLTRLRHRTREERPRFALPLVRSPPSEFFIQTCGTFGLPNPSRASAIVHDPCLQKADNSGGNECSSEAKRRAQCGRKRQ
jgi:hypothetical protein